MALSLSKREKFAVGIGIASCGIYLILQFVLFPYMEYRERLERNLVNKQKTLNDITILKAEYDSLLAQSNAEKNRFETRAEGFTLFSFLDRLAGEAGIKDNITHMKPSKSEQKNNPFKISMVEVKVQGINTRQLAPYLHKIETSGNVVYIKRLSISKSGKKADKGLIDAIIQVETYEL